MNFRCANMYYYSEKNRELRELILKYCLEKNPTIIYLSMFCEVQDPDGVFLNLYITILLLCKGCFILL